MNSSHSLPHLADHFDDPAQQFDAARLGMWLFLATEVMFFGGMFLGYTVYRFSYPDAFAVGSSLMELTAGTVNTAVLLLSSLLVALAIRSVQTNNSKQSVRLLIGTILLGITFLGIKAFEYWEKFQVHHVPGLSFSLGDAFPTINPNHVELFFSFYFVMTGFHALHVVIGLVLVSIMCVQISRGHFSSQYFTPLEMTGLYWHFVDIVWVFLFPMLYLIH